MNYLTQVWPWYVAGPIIGITMLLLVLGGKTFGMSGNLRTLCTLGGAGRVADLFRFDWRTQQWNLMLAGGALLGGAFAAFFLDGLAAQPIAEHTVQQLSQLGVADAQTAYLPAQLFGSEAWTSPRALAMLTIGGFLVGFGTRYAGGCTSGHAITGLSAGELPSLIAVLGFFTGGLLATHYVLPSLLRTAKQATFVLAEIWSA